MDINSLIIVKEVTIREAMRRLDVTAKKILFVVENEKLIGTLTDGDIRRWILKNGDLNDISSSVMNKNPIILEYNNSIRATCLMKEKKIEAVPLVDENNKLISVVFLNEPDEFIKKINVPVVIMAGGKGSRLYPYTKILPKPLIPIGDTPIIERIINKFTLFGCCDFYLTVNYKKNMIKSYFNELEKNYNIKYVDEDKPLGTGGSLYMLKGEFDSTFFVSNCDILIDADYPSILDFHKVNNNLITIVASLKHITIPYGVMYLKDDGALDKTVEKPELSYLINTGMYVLEPEILKYIPNETFFNLPDVIDLCKKEGKKVGVYPISEGSWMDMGQLNEMNDMIERLGMK